MTGQHTPQPAARQTGQDDAARADELSRRFTEVYGHAPDGVWRAPGRVNLIGEHTDYNDGFVLPFAIDRSAMVAVRLRRDAEQGRRTGQGEDAIRHDVVDLASTYAPDGGGLSRARFRIPGLAPGAVGGWGAYPAGVVHVLAGLDGVAQGRMLDLRKVIAAKLRAAGVERVEHVERCTSCEPERYFSHRRDRGLTGRQAGLCVLNA